MIPETDIRIMRKRYLSLLDITKNKIDRERIASMIMVLNAVLDDTDYNLSAFPDDLIHSHQASVFSEERTTKQE
jgi:hypothetical protein